MKMTNEEKQAFFGCYINQRVGCTEYCKNQLVTGLNLSTLHYLELRTVEMLDRQELLKLAELRGFVNVSTVDYTPSYSGYWVSFTGTKVKKFIPFIDAYQPEIDYLRSIGVLLGFRHFTPEMLISEGVVKVKGV